MDWHKGKKNIHLLTQRQKYNTFYKKHVEVLHKIWGNLVEDVTIKKKHKTMTWTSHPSYTRFGLRVFSGAIYRFTYSELGLSDIFRCNFWRNHENACLKSSKRSAGDSFKNIFKYIWRDCMLDTDLRGQEYCFIFPLLDNRLIFPWKHLSAPFSST